MDLVAVVAPGPCLRTMLRPRATNLNSQKRAIPLVCSTRLITVLLLLALAFGLALSSIGRAMVHEACVRQTCTAMTKNRCASPGAKSGRAGTWASMGTSRNMILIWPVSTE